VEWGVLLLRRRGPAAGGRAHPQEVRGALLFRSAALGGVDGARYREKRAQQEEQFRQLLLIQ
jgi:hypothetical protein